MEICFKDKKLCKMCENHNKLKAKYGAVQAERIIQRINELSAAASLYDISRLPQARLHSLTGNRKRQFAVDILHPYRLILFPLNGDVENIQTVTEIKIVSIVDYH